MSVKECSGDVLVVNTQKKDSENTTYTETNSQHSSSKTHLQNVASKKKSNNHSRACRTKSDNIITATGQHESPVLNSLSSVPSIQKSNDHSETNYTNSDSTKTAQPKKSNYHSKTSLTNPDKTSTDSVPPDTNEIQIVASEKKSSCHSKTSHTNSDNTTTTSRKRSNSHLKTSHTKSDNIINDSGQPKTPIQSVASIEKSNDHSETSFTNSDKTITDSGQPDTKKIKKNPSEKKSYNRSKTSHKKSVNIITVTGDHKLPILNSLLSVASIQKADDHSETNSTDSDSSKTALPKKSNNHSKTSFTNPDKILTDSVSPDTSEIQNVAPEEKSKSHSKTNRTKSDNILIESGQPKTPTQPFSSIEKSNNHSETSSTNPDQTKTDSEPLNTNEIQNVTSKKHPDNRLKTNDSLPNLIQNLHRANKDICVESINKKYAEFRMIVYRNFGIYDNKIANDIVHELKTNNLYFNTIKKWNITKLVVLKALFETLLTSLDKIKNKNIVFMACLNVLYRKVVDTSKCSIRFVYLQFLKFTSIVRRLMTVSDVNFWTRWLPTGWDDSFCFGCVIVDDILYGGLSCNSMHNAVNWNKITLEDLYINNICSQTRLGTENVPVSIDNEQLNQSSTAAPNVSNTLILNEVLALEIIETNVGETIVKKTNIERMIGKDTSVDNTNIVKTFDAETNIRKQNSKKRKLDFLNRTLNETIDSDDEEILSIKKKTFNTSHSKIRLLHAQAPKYIPSTCKRSK